jgi:tRNA G10  N-methylase Trm11
MQRHIASHKRPFEAIKTRCDRRFRKREATSRKFEVRQQTEQVQQNRKRMFTDESIARRGNKAEDAIAIKKERRSFE